MKIILQKKILKSRFWWILLKIYRDGCRNQDCSVHEEYQFKMKTNGKPMTHKLDNLFDFQKHIILQDIDFIGVDIFD